MTGPTDRGRARRRWYWLLVIPYLALLVPQLYASGGPPLFGMPFFYWYLIAGSVFTGIVTGTVYLASR